MTDTLKDGTPVDIEWLGGIRAGEHTAQIGTRRHDNQAWVFVDIDGALWQFRFVDGINSVVGIVATILNNPEHPELVCKNMTSTNCIVGIRSALIKSDQPKTP